MSGLAPADLALPTFAAPGLWGVVLLVWNLRPYAGCASRVLGSPDARPKWKEERLAYVRGATRYAVAVDRVWRL
jgi:hypothetical protein